MTATAAAMVTPPEAPAARQLGFWMAAALVVGNIIGAGVFLLPASLAPFGANAAWGWLLTISGCLCLAIVLGMLAARIEGGPYEYVRSTLGELPGIPGHVELLGVDLGRLRRARDRLYLLSRKPRCPASAAASPRPPLPSRRNGRRRWSTCAARGPRARCSWRRRRSSCCR